MPQVSKVERSFVTRTPAAQMHSFFSTKLPLMSTILPHHVSSVALLQGPWGKQGSVIVWDYNFQGKAAVSKQIMEVIDKKKYKIVYKEIEGEDEGGPLDSYKSFKWIFQAFPDDNTVLWTLEYEKKSDDTSEPTAYLDLISLAMEPVDSHLNSMNLN